MGQAKGSVHTLGSGLVWPGDKIKRSSCKFNIWQSCLTIRVAIVCSCWLVLLLLVRVAVAAAVGGCGTRTAPAQVKSVLLGKR